MRHSFLLLILFFLSGYSNSSLAIDSTHVWSNAKWIAYEKLDDHLKQVPAIHQLSDDLNGKCVKRSVVPMFRKDFEVEKKIEKATINISGIGHYELSINGNRIGDRFLAPGWTLYQKRSLYNTFDITDQLKKGENAIGVMVGNGFYNINRERYRKLVVAYGYPKLIFNITLHFKDGSVNNIVSDETCKVSPSPITFSSIYGGEDYDATLEQSDWDKAGFDDSTWQNPVILNDSREQLSPETDHPLKVMEIFNVQEVMKSKSGKTIYDFGQNASGIISLKVKGNKGALIKILPDELVNSEGNVTQVSGGGPYEFNYTLKGDGVEKWQPKFSYYGFRYADVEIIEPEDVKQPTKILDLKMLHTRNSSPRVGSFNCSDTLFNQIFELINWGIKSNMASVATDCPHREKLGWLEQTYLIGPSMQYNFNIHKLYTKVVQDMIDSQLNNGLVPDIAPEYVPFGGGFRDSPEWGSASVIIPWQMYKWYGDKDILVKAYPMMKRYVAYLKSKSKDNILDHGLGDWYDLGPKHPGEAQLTPKALTATAIYYYDLKILKNIASLLGKDDDNEKFTALSEEVKSAFQSKFLNEKTGECSTGSQTAYAMPLYVGLIPEESHELVFSNLVDSIKNNDYALTSGDVGYHFLVRVLSKNGRSDILYKMNSRSDRPGYGYQLKRGATALTESWAALPGPSNNHMMLGHLMEWFYAGLGGIYQSENSIAYDHIIIAPKPVGGINWVNCSYKSVKGIISSEWQIKDNKFNLKIEVPNGSSAKVVLPENYSNSVEIVDLKSKKQIYPKLVNRFIEIESGRYQVVSK